MRNRKDLSKVTPLHLKKIYEAKAKIEVPRSTWYDWLHASNIRIVKPRKGPFIKPQHYGPRSAFAKRVDGLLTNQELNIKDVIFMDSLVSSCNGGPAFNQGHAKVATQKVEHIQTGPPERTISIEHYAAVALDHKSDLMPLDEVKTDKLTKPGGAESKLFIKKYLTPMVKEMRQKRKLAANYKLYLVWDHAAAHIAKKALKALAAIHVVPLGLPPRAPELNVIEGLWNVVRNAYARTTGKVANLPALKRRMQMVWNKKVPQEAVNGLINSFHTRCKAMIQSRGQPFSLKNFKQFLKVKP